MSKGAIKIDKQAEAEKTTSKVVDPIPFMQVALNCSVMAEKAKQKGDAATAADFKALEDRARKIVNAALSGANDEAVNDVGNLCFMKVAMNLRIMADAAMKNEDYLRTKAYKVLKSEVENAMHYHNLAFEASQRGDAESAEYWKDLGVKAVPKSLKDDLKFLRRK